MKFTKLIRKFEKTLLIVVSATTLTAVLHNVEFNFLEASLYDFRMVHGSQVAADSQIVTIALDDRTGQELNEFLPLSLESHAVFLEALERLRPRAIGYLIDMNRVAENNPELVHSTSATRFVETARRIESKGSPFILGTPFDVTGEVLPPYPLSALPHSIAVLHRDGNVFAEDKITRRALTHLYDKPVFHLDLAQRLGLVPATRVPRGSFEVPEADARYFFFRYHGPSVLDTSAPHQALPYRQFSFVDVIKGRIPEEAIQGKTVLIGTLSKQDSADYAFTPFSNSSFVNPKLMVHATILDSLIHDTGIARAPAWLNWLCTFVLSAFVIGWVLVSKPLHGVFATLGVAGLFLCICLLLFGAGSFWIRASQPLVGVFLGYYLAVPYRLIREYKKRWDYQRKTELLLQVEELKTNFLSLVTHDLKTPVARIQGLAEVLLRKAGDRLIERDKETVNHIINATDELNRFISSILELSKVESQRLKLNLESKDINQLIEKLVESFKAQARARRIQIQVSLEPLFPIRIDSGLISKVLANLIDNALKYSQPGGQISIESREVGDFVEIAVKDQGIGMTPEEVSQLFTRFYRAKNDTTTQVAGTGLGLYLTRYFIQAHQGTVEVQSEKDKGSCFIIRLPINPTQSPRESILMPPTPARPGLTFKAIRLFRSIKKEKTNV
jgi:signal transduction histidine kinase